MEPEDVKPKKRSREEMLNGVTEDEIDEYRKKRTAADDPMAKMLGKDELLT
jgi:pre-mRNA-processing factor SLU7